MDLHWQTKLCKSKTIFRCFFNFQFSQASLLHSPWLLPFSICPWGSRSYGPCRLRRKGCYSPVTLTRSASRPALIYGHRGGVEVSWCTIGFQCCHPHPTLQLILPWFLLGSGCRGAGVWHNAFEEVTPKRTRSESDSADWRHGWDKVTPGGFLLDVAAFAVLGTVKIPSNKDPDLWGLGVRDMTKYILIIWDKNRK